MNKSCLLGLTCLFVSSIPFAAFAQEEESTELSLSPAEFKKLDVFEEQVILKAENNFKAEKYPEAMAGYAEFANKFPKSPITSYALYRQARCGELGGKKPEAIAAYKELVEKFPGDTKYSLPAMIIVADNYKAEKKIKEACEIWLKLACDPAYAKTPEALSSVDRISRALSTKEQAPELLAYFEKIAKSGEGKTEPAKVASKGLLKHYVKTAPNEAKLREFYKAGHKDAPADLTNCEPYWLWVLQAIEANGDFGWSEKEIRKKYYEHWIGVVGQKFPKSDDFQIAVAKLHYGADQDRTKYAERLDKIFKTQEKSDCKRILKWVKAYRKDSTKMQEYVAMITYENAGIAGIEQLINLLYKDLKSTYTAKNTFKAICDKLPYDKLSNEDIMKLIAIAGGTLEDGSRARELAGKLKLDDMPDEKKVALARKFLKTNADIAIAIYDNLKDKDAGKKELFDHFINIGDTSRAISIGAELEKIEKYTAEVSITRAKLLEDAERYSDAAESYKKAGKTLKLMNNIVTCFIKAEQTDKAVAQLKEIEKTFKKEAVGAAYRIACLYRDAEDTEKQKAALKHVVKNYQGTPEAKKAGKELAELEPLEIPDGPLIEL